MQLPVVMKPIVQAFVLFNNKRAQTLAAAATFYVMITIVPLVLIIVRGIGLFAFDPKKGSAQLFDLGRRFFPEVAPEMITKVQALVAGPLFGHGGMTFLNFVILAFSSLSFFNAIYSGMYLITNEKSFMSPWKYLRGIAVIAVTVTSMMVLMSLPAMAKTIQVMIQNNFVMDYIAEILPSLGNFLKSATNWAGWLSIAMKSNLFYWPLMVVYFTFLYRWFFNWKITLEQSFYGSIAFIGGLFLGKSSFWIYFKYARDGLSKNYGDFYTIIIGLMWVFFVMCFFFYGVCLCYYLQQVAKKKQVTEEVS